MTKAKTALAARIVAAIGQARRAGLDDTEIKRVVRAIADDLGEAIANGGNWVGYNTARATDIEAKP